MSARNRTPWINDGRERLVDPDGNEIIVYGLHVAHGHPTPQRRGNSEYIIRAVNSHDALLEALEACLEWIDAVPSETPLPAMPGFDRDDVDMLIAAAKGEDQ